MKVSIGTKYGDWATCTTGKGRFINRLIPELKELGAEIVEPGEKADIDLQLGKYVWEPNATKSIIRMGCPHFDDKDANKRKVAAIKYADAVIYQSEFARKWCDKLLTPAKKWAVINNGATPNPSTQQGYQKTFIASTRIWTKQKRLKEIVRAYKKAKTGILWIVGKVEKKHYATGVYYVGSLKDDKLIRYLKNADVMIHMCERDACPNSVVEAMMCGCRVITNEDAGTKELLTEKDIVIKHMGDLPKAMKTITPERLYPEKLDIKNVAKRYCSFFQEVLYG